jgi:tRNA nucleotidyltransferase (CCA-adding enzyme)
MISSNKIGAILREVLRKIEPEKEEIEEINGKLKEFLGNLKANLKKKKISAEAFVGGSFAKKTIIKKEHYDIDIFVRYNKKYREKDISAITRQALAGIKNVQEIHGSRDYFRVKTGAAFFIEVVPVLKIRNPKEAENITDLSYFHVKYVNKKIKNGKLLDEIRLAKAFCYANGVYGAESYVSGFSGYGLELLIYHYKSFINFIKAMSKTEAGNKIIIDEEKYYKGKNQVMLDVNRAKLASPVILIDPTHSSRNVLAALSYETFDSFRQAGKNFLKNPSIKAFETKKLNFEEIKNSAKKNKHELIILKATTDKQEGDIAGSKLVKFYKHLKEETAKSFDVKDSGFEYSGKKTAMYYFAVRKKPMVIKEGPQLKDKENARKFKRMHVSTFNKKGRIYAREKNKFDIKDFLNKWAEKNKKIITDMSVKELRVIG